YNSLTDFLKAIHLALKKEGVAIITVPNALFCFEKIDPGLMIHEHLNFFTPKTIEGILSVAGFKTINIKIKKDLLLLKFKKENSFSNKVNRNLFSGVINENEILLRNYVKNLPKVISKFKKIANIYKNNKIGLYGACGSAFNLLSLSNTKELKNLFFIDSDSTKWHKNLFGIPIIPPTELLKRRLNPIFIMPPAFEDDIFEYIVSLNLPQNIEIIKFWNT
ncbi:MAG: hypothetical protein ABSF55_04015, partial [Candidatus Staskawiczbacteria bacterium]